MKRIVLCITLIFSFYTYCAQAQVGQSYGGSQTDYGYEVEATSDGGFVIAGQTNSFGAGDLDYWVAKFDSFGNKIWDHTYGSSQYDQLLSLRLASDGGFLLAGLTGPFNSGQEAALLYKIKPDGQIGWTKIINHSSADHAHILFENLEGGYYMAGHTDSEGDPSGDIWVVKLDSAQNIIWDHPYGPQVNAPEHAHAAALTPDSGLIVLAHTNVSGLDKFKGVKIKKDGSEQWSQIYSGGLNTIDVPYEVRVTKEGNYAMFGSSQTIGSGGSNLWLLVTDTSGGILMDKHYGTGYNFCWSGRQTADGGYLMIGFKSPGAYGASDLLILKTDSAGNEKWTKQYGGADDDIGYGFTPFHQDQFVLTGSTKSFTKGGMEDMWVILVDTAGNLANFPTIANDAEILNIISPGDYSCNTTIVPKVSLRNAGTDTLSSVTVFSRVDSSANIDSLQWTGKLSPGDTQSVTLPATQADNGLHTFFASTSRPNGINDLNSGNDLAQIDFKIDTTSLAPSVTQGFESNMLPPTNWRLDGKTTWMSIVSSGGFGQSQKCLKANFYNQQGTAQFLSPQIDIPSLSGTLLNFSVAYARRDTSSNFSDTLRIDISTDCGDTWDSVYAKSGNDLATGPVSAVPFYPTTSQWRSEKILLDQYLNQRVTIQFDFISGRGNNLYVDDIYIGILEDISETEATTPLRVYPNPASDNFSVINKMFNRPEPIALFNITGEKVWSGMMNKEKLIVDISGQPNGLYFLEYWRQGRKYVNKVVVCR